MQYQDETGIQVIYPLQQTHQTDYVMANGGANFWYKLKNENKTSDGAALLDEAGNFIPNYMTSDNKEKAGYTSLRIAGDNGGADGNTWYVYAQKNQSGYKVRLDYYEYFQYMNGFEPMFIFGTNMYGQDIFACLAAGGRLSFLLAFGVSFINLLIGAVYGSIEGYYGGTIDIIMERISDVLGSVPFIVVATLFQLHLAEKAGPLLSLLFAFVLTGWIGIAARVRMQFYRFKGQEYVLAARTLGANDRPVDLQAHFPQRLGHHHHQLRAGDPECDLLRVHAELSGHYQFGNLFHDQYRHHAVQRSGLSEHLPAHYSVPGAVHLHLGDFVQPVRQRSAGCV